MNSTRTQANDFYRKILLEAKAGGYAAEAMAFLGRNDLWFLMTVLLGRIEMDQKEELNNDWLYDRCCDVQNDSDGKLDLWSREHYKSTIITFGRTVQDILNDSEETFGIFSVKIGLAQDFLKQIKQEFETNQLLKDLYPDVLYQNPEKESPCWGIDKGIRVKREANSREETVEAWGLINGMPTGKHFKTLVYDDVVTEKSVTNSDMLAKTFDMLRLSFSLGSHGGRRRMIGTRYHFNDAWGSVLKEDIAQPRVFAATDNGKFEGNPVLISREALAAKRRDNGPYIFGCQYMQDPKADNVQGFDLDWLRYYDRIDTSNMNLYLICDPAGEKKAGSDYTVMLVIGLSEDNNYYLVDGLRDRMNLADRAKNLIRLHRKWKPINTGYEKYGKDSDIEHIQEKQEQENYRFDITPLGGQTAKNDRIRKLVPVFEQGRFRIPHTLIYVDYEQKAQDLIRYFVNDEYLAFPVSKYDDTFDCMARIREEAMETEWPTSVDEMLSMLSHKQEEYNPFP